MKVRFTEDSARIADYKSRIALILADQSLDDTQKKQQINALRLEVMRKYSFYSWQMKSIDDFIRAEILQIEMEQSQGHRNRSASVIAS